MSTYTPIASQTLGSAAASVTFSSIPQGYTDLVVVASVGSTIPTEAYVIRFNSDTGNNYSWTRLSGNGSAATSGRSSNTSYISAFEIPSATDKGVQKIQLNNYSNTTTFKTALVRADAASYNAVAVVGLWRNTSAINSITISSSGTGNVVAGSTVTIYGIQVGNAAQKAQGGNIVTTDGTYVYHTFTSSGAFIPNSALTVDYLVVAGGGGGGGKNTGGGGGAGGYRTSIGGSALSLTAKSYPVIVGAGGAGGTSSTQTKGINGSNSIFSSITSSGGGGGGHGVPPNAPDARLNGLTGGSGGGGGGTDSGGGGTGAAGNSGSYSPVEGFAGGNGNNGANGGGGGGSSAVGTAAGSSAGGAGGTGTSNSISGSAVTYAAGGGGGGNSTAGTGGSSIGGNGGQGNPASQATAGSVNTGSGGGGAGGFETTLLGGAGGSGIVIIRYLA